MSEQQVGRIEYSPDYRAGVNNPTPEQIKDFQGTPRIVPVVTQEAYDSAIQRAERAEAEVAITHGDLLKMTAERDALAEEVEKMRTVLHLLVTDEWAGVTDTDTPDCVYCAGEFYACESPYKDFYEHQPDCPVVLARAALSAPYSAAAERVRRLEELAAAVETYRNIPPSGNTREEDEYIAVAADEAMTKILEALAALDAAKERDERDW